MPIPSICSQIIIIIACLLVAYGMDVAILQSNHNNIFQYILPVVTVGASIPFFFGAFILQVVSTSKEKRDNDEAIRRASAASVHHDHDHDHTIGAATATIAPSTPLDNTTNTNDVAATATATGGVPSNEPLVSSTITDSSNIVGASLEPITNIPTTAVAVAATATASSSAPTVNATLVRVRNVDDTTTAVNGSGTDAAAAVTAGAGPPPTHHYYSRFFLFLGVAAMILLTYCANQYLVRLFMEIHDETQKVTPSYPSSITSSIFELLIINMMLSPQIIGCVCVPVAICVNTISFLNLLFRR
jgi:cytoskeletal protein RodZ